MNTSITTNPAWEETQRDRIRAALEANWDAALEVGCMEHGGFDWLTEAAYRASRNLPSDVGAVDAALEARHAVRAASSEAPA
jgi:hypothetical protein